MNSRVPVPGFSHQSAPSLAQRRNVAGEVAWQHAVEEIDGGVVEESPDAPWERQVGAVLRAVPHRTKARDGLLDAKFV